MTKKLDETYIFTFGKYKGLSVNEILDDDPSYLVWANKEVQWFKLKKEVYDLVLERATEELERKMQYQSRHHNYSSYWDDIEEDIY